MISDQPFSRQVTYNFVLESAVAALKDIARRRQGLDPLATARLVLLHHDIYLSIYLYVYICLYLSIFLSIDLSIYLHIYIIKSAVAALKDIARRRQGLDPLATARLVHPNSSRSWSHSIHNPSSLRSRNEQSALGRSLII